MRNTDKQRQGNFSEFMQWVEAILIAVIAALIIRAFVFEPVRVEGPSMENTMFTDQRLILYKLGGFFNDPVKGDIVVIRHTEGEFTFLKFLNNSDFAKRILPTGIEEEDYIKRVIGVPGDTVDIIDGYVYVNDIKIDETYLMDEGITDERATEFPIILEEDEYIVFGDNRTRSRDSRDIEVGIVNREDIKGKAVFRFWPLNTFGNIE